MSSDGTQMPPCRTSVSEEQTEEIGLAKELADIFACIPVTNTIAGSVSKCSGCTDKYQVNELVSFPVDQVYKLVMLCLSYFPNAQALESNRLLQYLDVKRFLLEHAELFYFNRGSVVGFGLAEDQNVSTLRYLSSKKDIDNCTATFTERLLSGPPNTLEQYIRILVDLNPCCIIDDLICELFLLPPKQRQVTVNPASLPSNWRNRVSLVSDKNLALRWISGVVACKRLRRSMLKFIFEQTIYVEVSDISLKFNLLEMIIRQYSKMDQVLRIEQLKTEAAEMQTMLREARRISDNGEQNNINGAPSEPPSDDANYHTDLLSIESSIASAQHVIASRISMIQWDKEAWDNTSYYINTTGIETDNTFVLCSTVWGELIFILKDIHIYNSQETKSIIRLLTALVEETGEFFKNRIEKNVEYLIGIEEDFCNLWSAIQHNFKDTTKLDRLKNHCESLCSCQQRHNT